MLAGSGIGIWELELTDPSLPNARIVRTNVFEQLGYGPPGSRPDVPAILDLIHPDDRPRIAEAYQAIVAGETDDRELEYRLRHQDGSYRTMLMRGVAVHDGTGKPTRIIGSRIDITARRRAEAALEQRLALPLEPPALRHVIPSSHHPDGLPALVEYHATAVDHFDVAAVPVLHPVLDHPVRNGAPQGRVPQRLGL